MNLKTGVRWVAILLAPLAFAAGAAAQGQSKDASLKNILVSQQPGELFQGFNEGAYARLLVTLARTDTADWRINKENWFKSVNLTIHDRLAVLPLPANGAGTTVPHHRIWNDVSMNLSRNFWNWDGVTLKYGSEAVTDAQLAASLPETAAKAVLQVCRAQAGICAAIGRELDAVQKELDDPCPRSTAAELKVCMAHVEADRAAFKALRARLGK